MASVAISLLSWLAFLPPSGEGGLRGAALPFSVALATAQTAGATHVQFVVASPLDGVDDAAEIYCVMSVDGWNPSRARRMPRIAMGLYAASWELQSNVVVQYKFIRGPDWSMVEKGADGSEMANRTFTVPPVDETAVFHEIARWADDMLVGPNDPNQPRTVQPLNSKLLTGTFRHHSDFHSPQLNNTRTLTVLLPPDYERSLDRYPVLYMHDGQNLFDSTTSFAGVEWGVDETVNRLVAEGSIPPLIVVGISNTNGRLNEYTPFVDSQSGGGKADAYLDFLVNTVKPFIDANYRTVSDRPNTAIAGSSLGGLVTLYAMFSRQEVFGRGAALSTSLMWADWKIIDVVGQAGSPLPERLWVDVDSPTSSPTQLSISGNELKARLDQLAEILRSKGLPQGPRFHAEQPDGEHHETAWSQRLDRVLIHLFGTAVPI